MATLWSGVREISVRRYLRRFSDAVIPEAAAILAWMLEGRGTFTTPEIK